MRLYREAAHICESIKRYPNERPNLLITGSPGSGKELLAKAVSAMAGRPKDLFRPINCGLIPDQLVGSELFGVVPGYPGFHDNAGRKGLFQEANNGTVQLDEIGRASDKLQTLLLRVLLEREIRPLGGKAEKIDILFISTGNEILSKRMEEGRFQGDVYERISGERIEAPSLVPRWEDVPLLVRHFSVPCLSNPPPFSAAC